ncbi:MAG: hypothetical protein DI597_10815 [Pseudoxanthomonas spadix]|nr:MAG: hypothetical protein DI597_10815 [Pseudoxanthomonas spadix]
MLKPKFLVPPSALKPRATAIATNGVDLPLPFSPTMKVSAGWKARRASATARMQAEEYRSINGSSSHLSATSSRVGVASRQGLGAPSRRRRRLQA